MKKTLRMLCMGAMAAVSAVGFAQTDMTSKLVNADMEMGIFGWNVNFQDDIWKVTTKDQAKQPVYEGINNRAIEVWRSGNGAMTDNRVSQTVKNLPNGTYVFGAYLVACSDDDYLMAERDLIEGVHLFANSDSIPVGTTRPEKGNDIWDHPAKFNIATTVTDGTLTVGMSVFETNANFTLMDNATLYYFGDKEHTVALDEMAMIDIARTIAIADTCLTHKMNNDSLAYLQEQIALAKELTAAEEFYDMDEVLYWSIRKAIKSMKDYSKLYEALVKANAIAAKEWTDDENTVAALEDLKALIAAGEETYEGGAAERPEIETAVKELSEAGALVQLDSCYVLIDVYDEILDGLEVGEEVGQYSEDDKELLEKLLYEVENYLADAKEGDMTATEAKKKVDELYVQIQQIIDNPNSYDQFPIVINRSTQNVSGKDYALLEGMTIDAEIGRPIYVSPTYRFQEPLKKVRFTVLETGKNQKNGNFVFFSIGGLDIYDENGDLIEFAESDVYSNADHNAMGGKDGDGITGLLDGDPDTHFHSTFTYSVNENHYIEFTFPEGEYKAFSFKLTSRKDQVGQCPAKLDIRYVSESLTELISLVYEAEYIKPAKGTSVGCFNMDLGEFNAALAEAKALTNADYAADSEVKASIDRLTQAMNTLEENLVLPTPGKKYRIISAEDGFLPLQNVQKALTIHENSIYGQWLWWEDANADSLQQEFTLEALPEYGENFYAIKNTKYDLYLGDFYNEEGSRVGDKFVLTEDISEFEFRYLGEGQFSIIRNGQLHLLDHNNGKAEPTTETQELSPGAIKGVTSSVITWDGGINTSSSYMIQELQTLPYNAKSISDLNFKSDEIHMYKGYNVFTLTADKECAFSDLTIYGRLGQKLDANILVNGNVATVSLDTTAVASISFEFTNNEQVSAVTLDASLLAIANASFLEEAYEEALTIEPVEGNDVGQVADLSAYNAAIKTAETLIAMGGSEADLQAAVKALEEAVAGLTYNQPNPEKEYYIISALDFKSSHFTDMAIYQRGTDLYWTYVQVNRPIYRWKFVDCGEKPFDMPAYYVQNVETGMYISQRESDAGRLYLVETPEETKPYNVLSLKSGKVCVNDARSSSGSYCLHPLNHEKGSGKYGAVISYYKSDDASAMYVVEAEAYNKAYYTNIESIDLTDEYVAPAVKGTFDLFGRRIDTPATTGIYIVNGKKVVIK